MNNSVTTSLSESTPVNNEGISCSVAFFFKVSVLCMNLHSFQGNAYATIST